MKKAFVLCLTLCVIFPAARGASPKPIRFEKDYPLKAISDDHVQLSDSFWVPRLNANRQTGVPHCLKKLEETGVIGMFRTLNGSKTEGRYKNNPWGCSDAYKTFEALARVSKAGGDRASLAAANKQLDEFVKLIAGAQADDGFIFPYLQLYKKDYKPFSRAISNYTETYSMGHLLEMAVEHYQNTGSKEALKVANRVVDCIDSYYGADKKYDHPSGHPEIEIGLMRLHRATGDAKPLRLAKYLIEKAKTVKTTWSQGRPALADDDAVGHVVAMFYLYAGMVDVAQMSGDKKLMDLARGKWENIALKRTYITGSSGHRGHREGFGAAYDLPNDRAYCETCAAIAYVIWNHRMFLASGEAKYVNAMERTLYNGFLSGVSLSGDRFYYPNVLETAKSRKRVEWFGCPCCPTNVVRFLPRIPTYMYSANVAKGEVYVNLFASGGATFFLSGDFLMITQQTRYPRDGKVNIAYQIRDVRGSALRTADPKIKVRIPDWCPKPAWSLNGKPVAPKIEKGYAVFVCKSNTGKITLDCDMPAVRMTAHPKIKADVGRVAIMRGPLVYCFEGLDSPNAAAKVASQFVLAADQQFKTESKEIIPGMTVDAIVARDSSGKAITAIPYFARAYRKETSMSVWAQQTDLKLSSGAAAEASWKGMLYRRLTAKELGQR
jgi:uncharacterized protein